MATDKNASFLEDSRNEIDTELFLKLSATNDEEQNQGFLMCNDDDRTKGFLLCFDPTNNVCAGSEGFMSFFKRESWSTATVKGSKESASASSTASVQGGGSSANSSLASNEEKEKENMKLKKQRRFWQCEGLPPLLLLKEDS